jgi:hypothetical protein
MEERGGKGTNAGLNDFKKALEEMEMGMAEKDEVRKAKAGGEEGKTGGSGGEGLGMGMGEGGVLDLNLIKTDPDKLYPLIYYALKVPLDLSPSFTGIALSISTLVLPADQTSPLSLTANPQGLGADHERASR